MQAEQLLREGRLPEALSDLQSQIRKAPAQANLRVFLFQLQCILGRWDKALTQLNVAAELDPANRLMADVCRSVLQCEALRQEVFRGTKAPLVLGEPQPWLGWMIQALALEAAGNLAQAQQLRQQALEEAPAIAGTIDGRPFQWLADADPRLGPVFEAIIDGRYYWLPASNLQGLSLEKPADLRDLVWLPAQFLFVNGGSSVGFMPVRYPGSEASDDSALALARKTIWESVNADCVRGLGQRMLATDQEECSLLETRQINFAHPPAAGAAATAAAAGEPADG